MVTALVLLGIFATLTASLWVPVDLQLEAQAGDETWARVRVEWLYGRVEREFSTDDPKKPREEKTEDESSDPLAVVRDGKRVWESSLRAEIEKLLKELYDRIGLEAMSVHGRIGLGDPADTGIAMAAILPLADLANQLSRCDVDVEPCYEEAELTGDAHAHVRLVPAKLVPPLLAFGLSTSNLREMRALWLQRGK